MLGHKYLSGLIIAMLLSIASLCSCVERQNAGRCKVNVPDCEITAPLDSLFASMFKPGEPGAVVVVMRGDSIVYDRAFGVANFNTGMLMSDTTIMNTCSLTKSFTVAAVLKLQREGKLSIDDSLTKYFPEFNSDVFGAVTIRHIMNHTTGLPDRRPRNPDEWNSYRNTSKTTFGNGDDYLLYADEEEMVRFYKTVDHLENEPGNKYSYQEPPFMLLGFVIEKASGVPYVDYIRSEFFEPMGFEKTCFFDPDKNNSIMAHGYVPTDGVSSDAVKSHDGRWTEFDYGESPFFNSRPDHGIMTDALECVLWQRALYSGKVIPAEDVEATYVNIVPTRVGGVAYGFGTFVSDRKGFPIHPFHMSVNGGFSIAEAAFPESEVYYVVLSNRPDWKRLATMYKIDDILRAKGWI